MNEPNDDKAEPANDRLRLLLDLYRELDAELDALPDAKCSGCGMCCHFDKAGHILYASGLERALLAAVPLPRNPDADPDLLAKGLRCPFQRDDKCLAREARALGCRLHFCQCGGDEVEELSERWHRRLKELHDSVGAEWDYRPLLPLYSVLKND